MAKRINAIDAVRGFCLLNIFVNHITLGALHQISPSKIFFFDSADVFVLLAGLSTWLAYGPRGGCFDAHSVRARMWARAVKIYLFNLLLIACSFAVFLVGGWMAAPPDAAIVPMELVAEHGTLSFVWHVVTMQQSVGYSMVLRLYFFLMIVGPFYVWLGTRHWSLPLVPAAIVWVVAGCFTLVSRDSLTGQWLSMTILPWNLVFAAGISLGAAIKAHVALPAPRILAPTALAFAVSGTLFLSIGSHVPEVAAWLEVRNEHFWTGISKSLQSPLRLLHLASVVACVLVLRDAPLIRLIHSVNPEAFLSRLGRKSLEVFTFGAVVALAIDQILWALVRTQGVELHGGIALAIELALAVLAIAAMTIIAGPRTRIALSRNRPAGSNNSTAESPWADRLMLRQGRSPSPSPSMGKGIPEVRSLEPAMSTHCERSDTFASGQ